MIHGRLGAALAVRNAREGEAHLDPGEGAHQGEVVEVAQVPDAEHLARHLAQAHAKRDAVFAGGQLDQGRAITASRNLHRWAINYGIMDGKESRLTLLNNWETTYFDFNEEKLTALLDDRHLVVSL